MPQMSSSHLWLFNSKTRMGWWWYSGQKRSSPPSQKALSFKKQLTPMIQLIITTKRIGKKGTLPIVALHETNNIINVAGSSGSSPFAIRPCVRLPPPTGAPPRRRPPAPGSGPGPMRPEEATSAPWSGRFQLSGIWWGVGSPVPLIPVVDGYSSWKQSVCNSVYI